MSPLPFPFYRLWYVVGNETDFKTMSIFMCMFKLLITSRNLTEKFISTLTLTQLSFFIQYKIRVSNVSSCNVYNLKMGTLVWTLSDTYSPLIVLRNIVWYRIFFMCVPFIYYFTQCLIHDRVILNRNFTQCLMHDGVTFDELNQ